MFTQSISFTKQAITSIGRYCLWLFVALLFCGWSTALAQESQGTVQKVRSLYPSEWGVDRPAGVAYSTAFTELFLLQKNNPGLPGGQGTQVVVITPHEHFVGAVSLDFTVDNAINIAFDDQSASLFLLNQAQAQLAQVKLGADGLPDPATLQHFAIERLGLGNAQGVAIDATSRSLFILDSATARVINLTLDGDIGAADAPFAIIDLATLGVTDLRGIAVHPLNHKLYVASPATQKLYELTEAGQLVTTYDLSALALTDPRGFVFAPSADLTDAPTTTHLFLADSRLIDSQARESGGVQLLAIQATYLPVAMQSAPSVNRSAPIENAASPVTEAAQVQRNTGLLGEVLELGLEVEACHVGRQQFSARVASSADDAEEYSPSEPVRIDSTDLELIEDGNSRQVVGMRFTNVTIPAGAIILSATLTLATDEPASSATTLIVAGEAIGDAAPFTTTVHNLSSRSLTATRVHWQAVPAWNVAGEEQQSPSLAPLVQEVVNRADWSSGHALAFVITGEGKRVAKAFDGHPTAAPRLDITYVLLP